MLKTLPQKSKKPSAHSPSDKTIFALLNYSKSLTKLDLKEKKVLVSLN